MPEKRCDLCLNSRPIISENGIHYICCLYIKEANDCYFGEKDYFVKNPMVKTNEYINQI